MNIFNFSNYRSYLHECLGGAKRTGEKQKLSNFIGCQPALLSQILKGKNNLTLEAAIRVNTYLGHNPVESEYFLNLVHVGNSGTVELKQYYEGKNNEIIKQLSDLKKSAASESHELTQIEQATYYSNRLYALCHVAVSLPFVNSLNDLSELLQIPRTTLGGVVDFLIRTKIIEKDKSGCLTTGPGHTFIDKTSPFLVTHHQNIRRHGIEMIEKGISPSNIHYATYFTLSRKDFERLRKNFVELIANHLEIVAPSEEEVVCANIIDFFEVQSRKD